MFTLKHAEQGAGLGYQTPPQAIADLIDAPPTPKVRIDPRQRWLLILDWPNLISMEELTQPELRLAGIRINPSINGPSRSSYYMGMKLLNIKTGKEFAIKGLPENVKIRDVEWSPDGRHMAFLISREDGQDLWVVDVDKKSARRLIAGKVSSVYGAPFEWLPDNKTLICKVVPKDMGEPPSEDTIQTGPVVQKTSGRKAPARTYQDLLKNAYDEALFEYHFTVQILTVTLDGEETVMGNPGIIRRIDPSPDGKYIMVETVHRPFSYLVPAFRFPYKVEIWDLHGNIVKQIADLPMAEEVPIAFGAVPTGPRSFEWRGDKPAALYWVEAQDGGDPKAEAEIRDRVYILPAPFTASPMPLVSLQLRYGHISWSDDNLALVYELWWPDRRVRSWRIKPSASEADTALVFDFSWQDRYNHPGSPLAKRLPNGHAVLLTDGKGETLFLVGDGASPEGDRPFIDVFNIADKQSKHLWCSQAPYYERPIELL